MKLLEKVKNMFKTSNKIPNSTNFLGGGNFFPFFSEQKMALNEVTYFVCLKMLSEAISKMPLKLYQSTEKGVKKANNKAFDILRVLPNSIMTPCIFWTTIENNRNHYGNAYVWIRRKKKRQKYGIDNEILDFWVLPSEDVYLVYDDAGIFADKGKLWYVYTDKNTAKKYVFGQDEVLHFKTSATFDGVIGKPVRQILSETINGSLESQSFMNKLYKKGLTSSVALELTSDINEEKTERLLSYFKKYGIGSENAGGIVPVPSGTKLIPLNITLSDAQFFDLKKYNALQIASAFGIKPNQLNNYEKSSYSNSEMQQLDFYVDTMLYIQKQYEEELNYKLLSEEELKDGYYFKFNEKVILRSDTIGQMESLVKGVNNGIYTPNEARGLLDLCKVEGGDISITNGNYIPLKKVGEQYGLDNDNKE